MMESSDLYVFIAALVAVYLLPGPDMALILSTAALGGWNNGIMVAIGLALSRALHVTLAALGLAALFIAHPLLFDAVRWLGAAYLCWLAWRLLRTPNEKSATIMANHQAGWRALRQGFLTNLLNPKALMFCALLLPQFIVPTGNLIDQYLLLGTILVSLGAVFDLIYVFASSGIAHHFSNSRTGQKIARIAFASIFTLAAIRLAVSSR
jgi:threonine/homoserine/homoserine lactone efflux protein